MDLSNSWLQGCVFFVVGTAAGLGISYYFAHEADKDTARQLLMLQTLLVTAEEKGDVQLYRDAKGEITGGRVIHLQAGAVSETTATGDLTTGPGPKKETAQH
jgi:hypothetical protein